MSQQSRPDQDDEVSFEDLASFSTRPPPPGDVHNASTTVAELPPSFLESLKSPGAKATGGAPIDAAVFESAVATRARGPEWDGPEELPELRVELVDWDEPRSRSHPRPLPGESASLGSSPVAAGMSAAEVAAGMSAAEEDDITNAIASPRPMDLDDLPLLLSDHAEMIGIEVASSMEEIGESYVAPPLAGFEPVLPTRQPLPSMVPVFVVFVMALSLAAVIVWTLVGLFYS